MATSNSIAGEVLVFNKVFLSLLIITVIQASETPSSSGHGQLWWNPYNTSISYASGYRASYPSPSGGIIYRSRPEGRRQSRQSRQNNSNAQQQQPNYNRILVGEICDPEDPAYNKCTHNAKCISTENSLHRCNCTQKFEPTSDKKCRLSYGQTCNKKDSCNAESGLVCVDNKCECENSELYQLPSKSCRSKVGGSCTPSSTDLGIRFSKASTGCVKNTECKSFGPSGLSFRCVCKPGFVENRYGYCAAGAGMQCSMKGDCDTNIPLVCKQGICQCRDNLHVYDPQSNSCVGLTGAQCCSDPEGQRCISAVRTGCVEGAFCKETSMNLPGRCACLPFNLETEERLCKPKPI